MGSTKSQLSKSEFLERGLEILASDGPGSLTAARMARELNVTTGSFYWHFATVTEFRRELKRFWRDDIVIGIILEAREQAKDSGKVLEAIGQIIRRRGTYRYDAAMRSWAESDRGVEEIVRSADIVRRDLITEALRDAGASEGRARDTSNLLGAAWLGSQDMTDPEYRFKLIGLVTRDLDVSS